MLMFLDRYQKFIIQLWHFKTFCCAHFIIIYILIFLFIRWFDDYCSRYCCCRFMHNCNYKHNKCTHQIYADLFLNFFSTFFLTIVWSDKSDRRIIKQRRRTRQKKIVKMKRKLVVNCFQWILREMFSCLFLIMSTQWAS